MKIDSIILIKKNTLIPFKNSISKRPYLVDIPPIYIIPTKENKVIIRLKRIKPNIIFLFVFRISC